MKYYFLFVIILFSCGGKSIHSVNVDSIDISVDSTTDQGFLPEDLYETPKPELIDESYSDSTPQVDYVEQKEETTQEKYWEPLDEKKNISDLLDSYSSSNWYETLIALLERRYTTGHYIVLEVNNSKKQASSYIDNSSKLSFIMTISVVVHELTHILDFQESSYTYTYVVRHDLQLKVPYFKTYARNKILQYITWNDDYADVYLTGQMGTQGFDSLLDELNAYIQSLFTDYSFVDQFPKTISITSRDGVLTFMIYTELYLMHGRLYEQATYNIIISNEKWRELILTLWDRGDFILEVTKSYNQLGINDGILYNKAYDEEYLHEIELLREMQ